MQLLPTFCTPRLCSNLWIALDFVETLLLFPLRLHIPMIFLKNKMPVHIFTISFDDKNSVNVFMFTIFTWKSI